jgi:hypothetical protein
MSKRLIGGFGIAVAVLLALSASATAQKRTAPAGGDGVVPLNINSNSFNTASLFVDVVGNRVCGLLTVVPVAVHCEALPITIPAGAPVVPLNQPDSALHYFVVGEGLGTTQFCAVTSSPNVGTTVCSTAPF